MVDGASTEDTHTISPLLYWTALRKIFQAAAVIRLGSFTTDATGQLNVLWHDGNALGVNGTQVGVFEQTNQVGFGGFLESQNCSGLEAKVRLEVLSNLTHKALERSLANEEVRRLLVLADFTKSDRSRSVTVGLLDTSGSWCGLAGCLGGKL